MIPRVLVTGAAGFVGQHLCAHLRQLAPPLTVLATDRLPAPSRYLGPWFPLDLANPDGATALLEKTRPDTIVHLAGRFAEHDAEALHRANVDGLRVLLESVRRSCAETVVVTAGSAAEYGRVSTEDLPVTEETPCQPVGAYGCTKYAATTLARELSRAHGLRVMIVRLFQLLGQGVSPQLAPGAFAVQLARVAHGQQQTVRVGNLESQRDFVDVRDAVEAITLLVQQPAPGEIFNICSGHATRMGDLLAMMMRALSLAVTVEVEPQPRRGRDDVAVMYGSFEKLRRHCGWQPRRSLEQSVQEMLTAG